MSRKPSSPIQLPQVTQETRFLGRWFAAARRAGLLASLGAEPWQTLCAVLSFTSRAGERRFSADQLALALGQPKAEALARLEALTGQNWQRQPLLRLLYSTDGEVTGADLAGVELLAKVAPPEEVPAPGTAPQPVGAPSDAPAGSLGAAELEAVGLNPLQAQRLLREYSPERIRRQLSWLPARHPRSPAALLIRAIEGDWEPPQGAA